MATNPFIYGSSISDPAHFIGRRREIEQIQSRLLNAEFESSSIVGERRIGKTSLLKYLSHSDVAQEAGFPPEEYIFVYIDLQLFDLTKTPTDFWQRVLRAVKRRVEDEELQESISDIFREESIDTFILDDLFTLVDDINLHIVLLLDEFERVTQNKAFDVDFFSGLRAIAIHHNLALITSSRRELVELTHSKEVQDSPFFNIFANVNLRLFSEDEAETLIEAYLTENEISFRGRDIDYILEIAGPHPYFLQMACFFLYEAYRRKSDAQLRRRFLNAEFREKAAPMFSDYWRHSSTDQRVLLTVMALQHLKRGGGISGGDTLEQLKRFYVGAERTSLALEKRGLVLAEMDQTTRYRPFSLIFCDWVADELVARTGDEAVWIEWQAMQADRLNKLSVEVRQRVLGLLPYLNSTHAGSIGDWLLNPSTVNRAVSLLENFLGNYQQYRSSRPVAPVADTPLVPDDVTAPMPYPMEDRIQDLRQQLDVYRRNLSKLELQVAQYGDLLNAPIDLQNRVEATKSKIGEIERELEKLSGER